MATPAVAVAPAKADPGKWVVGKTEPIANHYTLGKALGDPGQFGRAVKAVHKRTSQERAVKIISKARFSRSAGDQKFHFDQLRAEIDVMRKLDHPNVIKMYDVFESESELFIVMECCNGGELFDRIKTQGNFSERDASNALRQMTIGLQYMHAKGIAHCDLKPDNFLFLSKAADAPLKIIDFGMSKFVKRREYFEVICGTPYYVAPEVIEGKYSEHCDMWSLGVVLFVMLFGYPPFYADQEKHGANTDEVIFSMVKRGFANETKDGYGAHFPRAIPCSPSAKDLISKLLTLDIASRYTAAEALEHPWMQGTTASDTPLALTVLNNLSTFDGTCKFKTAILSMMTDSLGADEIKQLKATFEAIDENGDGSITLAELKKAMAKPGAELKGVTEEELERLLKLADFDGDGALSYKELLSTCVNRKLQAKEERIWETFCKLDLNGDGRITVEEIAKALGDDSKRALELIAEVDKDGDGTVSYDEFLQMWQKTQDPITIPTSSSAAVTAAASAPSS